MIRRRLFFFLLFLGFCAFIFYLPYKAIRETVIENLYSHQRLLAAQAAKGIEEFFKHLSNNLDYLSHHQTIISLDETGKQQMDNFFQSHQKEVLAITRVDATGNILYTSPRNDQVIGKNISGQEHNRYVMNEQKPVVSNVFQAVQGFASVALAYPVFDNGKYAGSISVLIPFRLISSQYVENIKIGTEGYAWLIDTSGVELYCPVPGHIGKTVYETSSQFPSVIEMAKKMMKGETGDTTYSYDRIRGEETEAILKYASYVPIVLPHNHWSIVVATAAEQALAPMNTFRNQWIVIIAFVMLSLFSWISWQIRQVIVSRAEKKLRKTQQQLEQSEQTLADLIRHASVPMAVVNVNGRIEMINEKCRLLYGYDDQELQFIDDWFDAVYDNSELADQNRASWQKMFAVSMEGVRHIQSFQRTFLRKDRTVAEVEFTFTQIGERFIINFNDLTEKNRLKREEEERKRSKATTKKMESLGLLAGGVAHDLNNILSGVVSLPELLLLDLPEDSPQRLPLEEILNSGRRAAAVVADLLTVARGVASTKEVVSLNSLLKNCCDSVEIQQIKKAHPRVSFVLELDDNLSHLSCSLIHIRKVITNLAANAAEAINGEGTVVLVTRNQHLDMPLDGCKDVPPGEYVVLQVTDTGPGIKADDLDRIFEPFYSRKVMGRSGTGLGLTVVWNTMLDHQGYICVSSSERGTSFELFFPVCRDELSLAENIIPLDQLRGNNESILVVDDVEEQRLIARRMLERLNYSVSTASSGEEALALVREKAPDLVVLDMLMEPGMNGRETYEQLLKVVPGLKSVVASGFAETEEVRKVQAYGAGSFVKKPYTMEEVGVAIKKELTGVDLWENGSRR
ncbi:MAG: response regulator [Proteobacteria bacterium]|nr:response regulator [Pseudomonadota bacterium]MBU1418459.1 response regulator [Pseudomonadota bacterium]MBU1456817.1 response regulator [Pseudomonadota bacterium]